jgi:hypothetical protein
VKRAFALLAGTAALLSAGHASAFELGTPEQKGGQGGQHQGGYHSSQNFAFEVRAAPYHPQIDDEPGLSGTPYKKNFGDSARVYLGLELDWQVWRIPGIGTIGPGLSVGRVSMSRDARTVSGRESGDSYTLTLYPMYLTGVLRIDTLWRNFGIPLMPYGKAGLAAAPWSADNALGTSTANGVKGSGTSLGTNIALGGTFPLDFFDSGASRSMDSTTGINTTSIYFEYYSFALNGFGSSDTLRVGTNSWSAGMTFEF